MEGRLKFTGFWMAAVLVVITSACYYDNVEDLYPNGCNTTDVTYSEDVVSILQSNCLSCHNDLSEQGGVNLDGYDNLIPYVEDGSFMGSIRHEEGWEPMPLTGGMISSCSIDKLQAWIDAGALNN